ncbi:hypothetical protein EVAR_38709_1 [Eumeta japonica]|uniref:Uncharacterized protein n=1 Tax=Eumeta variegata TaxID=151549 RepID=A0A4C1XMI3_EUMVA|nr:hypothetical protein EVAR_38709_1 [Eumeta japonica]
MGEHRIPNFQVDFKPPSSRPYRGQDYLQKNCTSKEPEHGWDTLFGYELPVTNSQYRRAIPHFGFSFTVTSKYKFMRCARKMMNSVSMFRLVYCITSFTSGGQSATAMLQSATDALIPLQLINGASA